MEVDVDIEVEATKSQDWAVKEDSTEEPLDGAEEVKKEATEKLAEEEDFLKVLEGWRRDVVTTREWQELKPRTVRTVEAFPGREDEAEFLSNPVP